MYNKVQERRVSPSTRQHKSGVTVRRMGCACVVHIQQLAANKIFVRGERGGGGVPSEKGSMPSTYLVFIFLRLCAY